jgi:uncharacterized protein (TIGR02611 family)
VTRRPEPDGDRVDAQAADGQPADEPGLLDELAERLGFRDRIKANPTLGVVYRVVVAVIGVAVIALGVVLLPLPGPGWLIIFLGLGILASEFAWAERLLGYARHRVHAWTRWVGQQPVPVRLLIGLAGLVLVGGIVATYLWWAGVPSWVPGWVPLIG